MMDLEMERWVCKMVSCVDECEGDPELLGVKILEGQDPYGAPDPVHVHEFIEIIIGMVSCCGFIEVRDFGVTEP